MLAMMKKFPQFFSHQDGLQNVLTARNQYGCFILSLFFFPKKNRLFLLKLWIAA